MLPGVELEPLLRAGLQAPRGTTRSVVITRGMAALSVIKRGIAAPTARSGACSTEKGVWEEGRSLLRPQQEPSAPWSHAAGAGTLLFQGFV